MTYWLNINQTKTIEWGLSLNEAAVMCVFSDLESWATKFRSDEPNDGDFYYVLYLSKIVKETPVLGSRQTVGRAVARLEKLGIIKSINKHSTPAYALTDKGLSWKKIMPTEPKDIPNGGESSEQPPQPKPAPKKERKKNEFALPTPQRVEDLSKEYTDKLFQAAMKKALAMNISNPKDEFEDFLLHHSKKGSKWANWLSAFHTWCKNNKKYSKPNGGESDTGLYQ